MTDFRLKLQISPLAEKIIYKDQLFLSGSCFTEHISEYLKAVKFEVLDNPNGILFNPISICDAIASYIENKQYRAPHLFTYNELWHSWDHHSRFSSPEATAALDKINASQDKAHRFLKDAQWLVLTLGSAFVYELLETAAPFYTPDRHTTIVANCHKVPANQFRKRLLTTEEILSALGNMTYRLLQFNPQVKIIFTVSPVRHLRDGFVENNRSKAVLLQAVHQLIDKFDGMYYFPAYELVIDDLRDYRFFAEDMVHPNYLATQYVWDTFQQSCIHANAYPLIKEMTKINAALRHRPLHPRSASFRLFLQSQYTKVVALQNEYPGIDFKKELDYFGNMD